MENDETSKQLKNKIYTAVVDGIVNFIDAGLKCVILPDESKVKDINLFLGGDFNDADGEILKRLLGIKSSDSSVESATTVTSNTSGNTQQVAPNGLQIFEKNVVINCSNYNDKLYSCCANRDSQKYRKDGKSAEEYTEEQQLNEKDVNKTTAPLDVAFKRIIGKVSSESEERVEEQTNPLDNIYPYIKDFYKADSFGYYGDYVLYGTSLTHRDKSSSPGFNIEVDNSKQDYFVYNADNLNSENEQSVMASDHLPVRATVSVSMVGGGRRRRYSRRAPIRRTRKGVPKKLRASRRKRRARTYKKF
jgi:hypothetical protein